MGCAQIFTEKWLSGTPMKATIPNTAASRAFLSDSGTADRTIKYAAYDSHRIRAVVSWGTHTHQTPHTYFAQIMPVIRTSPQNITPISADDDAKASHFKALVFRYRMLETNTMKKAR